MPKEEYIKILSQGVDVWNRWRKNNRKIEPNLIGVNLAGGDFSYADFRDANLHEIDCSNVNLSNANLSNAKVYKGIFRHANLAGAKIFRAQMDAANLSDADLRGAELCHSNLSNANLTRALLCDSDLSDTTLVKANISEADLTNANLFRTNLSYAKLDGAQFHNASVGWTLLAGLDLSAVKGLNLVKHSGPSPIGIDTLYLSNGIIPNDFLYGCGIPEEVATYLTSLIGMRQAIQFYSCFISYSHKDEDFAKRLYSRMRDTRLRVWFAPEDIKGGEKLHEQIDKAIQLHDRLLIILSEHSLESEWVMTEIRRARKTEIKEGRRKLFPIRLVNFDIIREWECFDADTGKDLAVEVREYFIPDFSNWKDYDSFEAAFNRLLKDLRAAERK